MLKSKLAGSDPGGGRNGGRALGRRPQGVRRSQAQHGLSVPDFLIYTKQCKQLASDITKASGGKLAIEVLPFNSIRCSSSRPRSAKAGST